MYKTLLSEKGIRDASVPLELNFSSSEKFYRSLIKQMASRFTSDRDKHAVLGERDRPIKILSLHASGATLEAIGNRFHVTRERVRQIEKKTWHLISRFKRMLPELDQVIESYLISRGGFDLIQSLQDHLQKLWGWSPKEISYLLDHYFENISNRFQRPREEFIAIKGFQCAQCPHFLNVIKKKTSAAEKLNLSITVDRFAVQVAEGLEEEGFCTDCSSKTEVVSQELLLWLIKTNAVLARSQERMTIRRDTQFPGLNRAVLLVLKLASRPMSKYEILETLRRSYPERKFGLRQVQSTTSNSPRVVEEVFLWGRGGLNTETLYIHKDYVPTKAPVLDKIEKDLLAIAKEGKLPQIRLNQIYLKYANECNHLGIPNVYALFSALKIRKHPEFQFQRSPYIGFADHRLKESNARILEQFVIGQGRPVSRQEIRKFGEKLGLQHEHISNTILLTDLYATQAGYIYYKKFPVKSKEFALFMKKLTEGVENFKTVSVHDFFKDESDLCAKLGIVDSKMLYAVLRRFAKGSFTMKYPMISELKK